MEAPFFLPSVLEHRFFTAPRLLGQLSLYFCRLFVILTIRALMGEPRIFLYSQQCV